MKKERDIECKPLKVTTFDGSIIEVVNYPALLALDADVYLIFGMRSFGKSYGLKEYAIKRWIDSKEEFCVIRTIDDDITQSKARRYISDIIPYFEQLTEHEKELSVYSSDFIARSFGEGKTIVREKIGSVLSLSGWLKYKGNSYENVTTIIFEEFLERKPKLSNDAFLEGYLNNLSTIIRLRQNVKVFCLANTVRKKSPIFDYYHIDLSKVKKGIPALFSEENGLKVCVYHTPDVKLDQQTAKHYTVDESKTARMITSGEWEENDYLSSVNGVAILDLLKTKRYRRGVSWYVMENGKFFIIPCNMDKKHPAAFITDMLSKPNNVIYNMKELFLLSPHIYQHLRLHILAGHVIHDGKCADLIDSIKDNIL